MNISKIVRVSSERSELCVAKWLQRCAKCGVLGALVAMGMTAVAADQEVVQLWKDGPYWATSNLGESKVAEHPEYGALYKFDDAGTAVKSTLGQEWRVPSKDDFDKLTNTFYCVRTWDSTKKGYTFTGATAGYTDKSIFFPAAGHDGGSGRENAGGDGIYWSSEASGGDYASCLYFTESRVKVSLNGRINCLSVRAVKDPPASVTIDAVESVSPWDSAKGAITVDYSVANVDSKLEYKVAFDVTAKDQTASVTNDAAKLTDGAATKVIDTAKLFGKQVVDTKAKVKVTLIAIKPKEIPAGQLWENGPIFAECNVGANAPQEPGYYFWWGDTVGYKRNTADDGWVSADGKGTSIKFSDESPANTLFGKDDAALADYVDANGNLKSNYDAARAHLGAPWRMMTKDELDKLVSTDYCQREWVDEYKGVTVNGWVVKGKAGSVYENNEVFFPAAGYGNGSFLKNAGSEGRYWFSTPVPSSVGPYYAWLLYFTSGNFLASNLDRYFGLSVRAVRDAE